MIGFSHIIDISWPITKEITEYKNKKEFQVKDVATFEKDGYRKSTITLSVHTGTHVDAPSHFLCNGGSVNTVPLSSLIGPCHIFDMLHINEKITFSDVERLAITAGDIVIFKTKNSLLSHEDLFDHNFVYIDKQAAQFLADREVRALGFDYLGIERNQPEHETHNEFLSKNIAVIEGLRLKDVSPGLYTFCCLPLNILGVDGAPARAVLLK